MTGYTHSPDGSEDHDNSHEFKGHGVSEKWVKDRVAGAAAKGGEGGMPRVIKFRQNMERGQAVYSQGKSADAKKKAKKYGAGASAARESNWAAWKAKKGK